MSQGKQIKGKFIWRSGDDRRKVVESIKRKIDAGFFSSEMVISELVDKLSPQFSAMVDD
ncbi:MAG: hypothetical protein HQK83_11655 [Fibrobacteria bacterium]|nr:hypothetical protein [Fibrobacteria bacterium]